MSKNVKELPWKLVRQLDLHTISNVNAHFHILDKPINMDSSNKIEIYKGPPHFLSRSGICILVSSHSNVGLPIMTYSLAISVVYLPDIAICCTSIPFV